VSSWLDQLGELADEQTPIYKLHVADNLPRHLQDLQEKEWRTHHLIHPLIGSSDISREDGSESAFFEESP